MISHLGTTLPRLLVSAAVGLVLAGGVGCKQVQQEAPKPARQRYTPLGERSNVPSYMRGTIWERVELGNTEGFPVSGYGLLVNLDHTGNNDQLPNAVKEYMVKEMTKRGFGSPLLPSYRNRTAESVLADDRTAVVQVDALLPPGVRKGQQFDVRVSVLTRSRTTSVARGQLYLCDLAINGANPQNPFDKINVFGEARGFVFINPTYALLSGSEIPATARMAVRQGIIMNGGVAAADRPIFLRLREPQASVARAIEQRIISRFKSDANVASAHDEGIVSVFVPESYGKNWQHFVGVVLHTYLNDTPEFETMRAKELAEEAVKPGAALDQISYCWEALGAASLPYLSRLIVDPDPRIAFAAARAGALIGDPTEACQSALLQMARTAEHPFQIEAVQVLGELPDSPSINRMLRQLLDSDKTLVRLEAYRVLARNHDSSIFSKVITEDPNNQKFILDVVPSLAPPLIYATRSGVPRIAILGAQPRIERPVTFAAFNGRLTISALNTAAPLTVFYRDPLLPEAVKVYSNPDLSELIRRLGGEAPSGEQALNFSYGEIIAMLQGLSDQHRITAERDGAMALAPFVLQQPARLEQTLISAPAINARPVSEKSDASGEQSAGAVVRGRPQ